MATPATSVSAFRTTIISNIDRPGKISMEHWRYYILGRTLEALGRGVEAIEAYKSALRVRPDFHRCSNRIAYILSGLGRFEEAEPYFIEAIRAEPGNAVAHFNLGYTYDKRGQYEKAVQSFREATRLN